MAMGDQDNGQTSAGHDVKAMLADLMGHISEADQRSGAILQDMHARLKALGQDTKAARSDVPDAFRPGFDRIQNGLVLLAEEIARSHAARSQAAVSAAPPAPPVAAPPAVATPAVRSADHEPDALRSSAPTGRARPRAIAADVDTFDVIESLPGNPVEPWSPDQVEALASVYAAPDVPFAAGPAAPAGAAPEATASAVIDHSWLDARLAKVATRLEASIANANPDVALASLIRRLGDIELGLAHAMAGLATKGDLGKLPQLEAQIGDLRAQFEQAHARLVRMDDIERQLAQITHQTSSPTLEALAGRLAPAASSAPRADTDFHAVAIAAAEAAASRVAIAHRHTDASADVHALLSDFISERRQGDEQTANTLDTLQQAMLRLLDRLDELDGPQYANQAYANHDGPSYAGHETHQPEPTRANSASPALQPALSAVPAPFEALISPLAVRPPAADPVHEPDADAAEPAARPLDYLAEQRAKMQASAQRAAAAQRDKAIAAETPAATRRAAAADGREARAKPRAPSARLMVSGLALAVSVAALGAGALVLSWPRADAVLIAGPAPAKALDQRLPTEPAQPSARSMASAADRADARLDNPRTASALNAEPTPTNDPRPQTVTGDLDMGPPSAEPDFVPDANPIRADVARSQTTVPAPVTGILLQKTSGGQAEIGNAVRAAPVAAHPEDFTVEKPSASVATGGAQAAFELPPATVGPLSLRLAAAQGDISAQFEVASRLAEGKGTDQNLKEAVRWYQRAATQGFAQAQYRLGTFYERGLSVKADSARARSWYERAAQQGNVKAMHNLAVLAAGRSAQSPDYATAAKWFTQAANYGLADSQFNLAVLTESGLGVERDMVQAAMWFTLAARAGDKEATRRRDAMATKMDKTDLAAADHLARTWQAMVPEKLANDPHAAGEAWKSRQASTPDNG